jgi:hypothetical protein
VTCEFGSVCGGLLLLFGPALVLIAATIALALLATAPARRPAHRRSRPTSPPPSPAPRTAVPPPVAGSASAAHVALGLRLAALEQRAADLANQADTRRQEASR